MEPVLSPDYSHVNDWKSTTLNGISSSSNIPTRESCDKILVHWAATIEFWYISIQLSSWVKKPKLSSGNSDSSCTHMQHATVTVTFSAPKITPHPPPREYMLPVVFNLIWIQFDTSYTVWGTRWTCMNYSIIISYCGPFLDWSPSRPKYHGNIKSVPSRFFLLAC